jgi:hypothetical protein
MLNVFWAFLKDSANREILGWIGTGIVAVAGGLWAVVSFYSKKDDDGGSTPSVRADRKSVAIGRDNTNSPINIDTRNSG